MKYLSIAAVFKDEDRYLDEWITYHTLLGVEHFYLLNNSTNPLISNDLLLKYKNVDVITFQSLKPQHYGYNYLLDKYRGKTQWLAFIDIDEFIYPTKLRSIPELLQRYEHPNIAALAIHWCLFGSSGKELTDEKSLVIEAYYQRARKMDSVNNTIKLIVKPELTISSGGAHWFKYKRDTYAVNELKQIMPEGDIFHKSWKVRSSTINDIRINHYCVKSREEYRAKVKRGFVDKKVHEISKEKWKSYWNEMDRNEIRDDTMKRFIPIIKERLKSNGT